MKTSSCTERAQVRDVLLVLARGDSVAAHPLAEPALWREVDRHLPAARELRPADFAALVERLGKKKLKFRHKWDPNPTEWLWGAELHGVRMLAIALWKSGVGKAVAHRRRYAAVPGMAGDAITEVVAGLHRQRVPQELDDGCLWEVRDYLGRGLDLLTQPRAPGLLVGLLEQTPTILRKLPCQRLIFWAAHRAWEQDFVEERREPARIIVPGGWTELARLLRLSGQKSVTQIRQAAEVLDHARITLRDTTVPLLTLAMSTRSRTVAFTVEGPLRPRWINEMKQSGVSLTPDARRLVPIVPPDRMPSPVGGPTARAAEGLLVHLVMREFRAHAVEMVQTGDVPITKERWGQLADEAGVAQRQLARILGSWVADSGFLVPRETDRYDLGPTYQVQRDAIEEGGRKSLAGKARRRRSTRR